MRPCFKRRKNIVNEELKMGPKCMFKCNLHAALEAFGITNNSVSHQQDSEAPHKSKILNCLNKKQLHLFLLILKCMLLVSYVRK